MPDLLAHAMASGGIDELYLAAGTICDDDIGAGRTYGSGFFIGDFL
jgi:hypothetical protein